jgi:hypothetical protein
MLERLASEFALADCVLWSSVIMMEFVIAWART